MFWSSPSRDLNFVIITLAITLIISLIIYWKSRKILLSIFVLSLIGNLIIYDNVNLRFAISYNMVWLFKFTRNIWLYANAVLAILLVFSVFKNKYTKK